MLRYDRVSPFELPRFWPLARPVFVCSFFWGVFPDSSSPMSGARPSGSLELRSATSRLSTARKFPSSPHLTWNSASLAQPSSPAPELPSPQRAFCAAYFLPATPPAPTIRAIAGSDVDAQYTVPKLHDLLKVYVDTFTDDELFPLAYPTHSAWSPGFYLARLPHLPHMDFRAEGYLTPRRTFPGFYYFNVHYLSGYTNDRQLLGNWIGRESERISAMEHLVDLVRGVPCRSRARHQNASSAFLRGGDLRDLEVSADLALSPHWQLGAAVQQERWRFPLLPDSPKNNVTATIQLSYPAESRRNLMATAEIIASKTQPMPNWVRNANLLWDHRRLLARVAAVALVLSATIAFLTPEAL